MPLSPQELREEWNKKFKDTDFRIWDSVNEDWMPDHVADFWLSKIEQAREEGQSDLKRELLEACEKMEIKSVRPLKGQPYGYNQAIKDIKQLLR